MGCWNQTCAISNLPITNGEKVVLIPLIATSNAGFQCGTTYYTTDCYVPLSMPIYGEYNEYGSITNIETLKINEEYLLQLDTYVESKDSSLSEEDAIKAYAMAYVKDVNHIVESLLKITPKEKIGWNSLQGLVDALTYDGFIVNNKKNDKEDGNGDYRMTSYVMIHRKLYDAMVDEISKRIPYAEDKSYRELYKGKIVRYIKKTRIQYKDAQEAIENATTEAEKKLAEVKSMLNAYPFNNHAEKLGITDLTIPAMGYNYMIERLIEEDNDELMEELLNSIIFTLALSLARSGYHVTTGLGSQGQEYQIHRIIATFVESHIKDVVKKMKEDECDEEGKEEEDSDEGYLTETLFWWDN